MFQVKNYNNRYAISIGVGKTFSASDLQEVVYALEHYFQRGVPGYSGDKYDHRAHTEHAKNAVAVRYVEEVK